MDKGLKNNKYFLLLFLTPVLLISCHYMFKNPPSKYQNKFNNTSPVYEPIKEIFLKGGDTGILLIHGYAASSLTMKPIAYALNKYGFTVYCPLLPGHGTNPEDLEKVYMEDYYNYIEKAYKKFHKKTSKIVVVGHSLGSLLAIRLSKNHKMEAVILISPPLLVLKEGMTKEEIHDSAVIIGNILGKLPRPNPTYLKNPDYFRKYGIYTEFPVSSLEVLAQVVNQARKDLIYVNEPLLVILGNLDPLVDLRTGEYIKKTAKSFLIKVVVINSVGHRFFLGEKMPVVIKEICAFIKDINAIKAQQQK